MHSAPRKDGEGVDPHQALATLLFRHAAECGDPQAQGQMGLRHTLGLQDLSAWDKDGIVAFGEVRAGAGARTQRRLISSSLLFSCAQLFLCAGLRIAVCSIFSNIDMYIAAAV